MRRGHDDRGESAVRRGDGPGPGSLRDDPDGRPHVGLAPHLRPARADGRPRSPRPSTRAAARSAARPGSSERRAHPADPRRGDRREYFTPPPEALDSVPGQRRSDLSPDPRDGGARPRGDGRPPARGAGAASRSSTTSWRSSRPRCPRVVERFLPRAAPARPAGRTSSMTAVIQTERLTKSYGAASRASSSSTSTSSEGEVFGFLGPERRRQDDDDADPARPHPADVRPGRGLRHRDDRRPGRDPPPRRLPARRVRPVRPADRRADDRLLREPARRRRPRLCRRSSSSASTSTRAASSRSTRRATSRRSASSSPCSTGRTC